MGKKYSSLSRERNLPKAWLITVAKALSFIKYYNYIIYIELFKHHKIDSNPTDYKTNTSFP
jgi:hypothetical protein